MIKVNDIHHEFFGKNFCIEKNVLIKLGGFYSKLGRMGTKLVSGEETLIYRQLIRSNFKVYYFTEASVGHRLKPKEYLSTNIEKQFLDSADSAYHLAKAKREYSY
jgi:hypothetical protein